MTTAAYYRAWRAAHPEYRERQRERRRQRRAAAGRGDRSAEYALRAAKRQTALEPIPLPHTGHPLFDLARSIVGATRSGLTILHDPLHEDLLSVAVVALVEGVDPVAAVKAFRSREIAWRRTSGPLLVEFAA